MNAFAMTKLYNGRQHCPNCGANDWLLDQSADDGIKLHTDPESTPGNLGCNCCGNNWTPEAVG